MKPQIVAYVVKNANGTDASLMDFVHFFSDGRYTEMISKGYSPDFMFSVYHIEVQMALLPGPFAHTINAELKQRIAEKFYIVTK